MQQQGTQDVASGEHSLRGKLRYNKLFKTVLNKRTLGHTGVPEN
jgi:hypothetical protein